MNEQPIASFDEIPEDARTIRARCQQKRPNGEACNYSLTFNSNMRDWAKKVMDKHVAKHREAK